MYKQNQTDTRRFIRNNPRPWICHKCGELITKMGRGSDSLAVHHVNGTDDDTVVPMHHRCHNQIHKRTGWKWDDATKKKISASMKGNQNKRGKSHRKPKVTK